VTSAVPVNAHLKLALSDNTTRRVDHVILGTGYRVDVARYRFLGPDILQQLRIVDGFRFSVLRWSPPYQDYIFSAPPLLGAMVPSCTSFLERNTRQMLSSAMSQYPHESPREYLSTHGCLAYQDHA